MADEQDFKIFISWSGTLAKGVARALRDWLPTMFDHVEPWFSDTDIPAGATWFGEIQERLNCSDYGIVIITTENLDKPWLNFEAGSLSKKLNDDIGRVTPVLVNFDQVNQLTGHPLEQYNAVLLDEDGMRRLCDSIARSAGLNPTSVGLRFDQMWGGLQEQTTLAKQASGKQPPPPEVSAPERLDALTASVRSLEATVAELVRTSTGRHVQPDIAFAANTLSGRRQSLGMAFEHAVGAIREVRKVTVKTINATTQITAFLSPPALDPDERKRILNRFATLSPDLQVDVIFEVAPD